ncbi:FAD-dependent oxidoreductase [Stieleria sp. JC731]|uniref:NAD(P)/FAD-dependent oxidoreductase n=1 Tax=Pirellulaceae TaxID=2691357 RepID=UPI001E3D1971|nr:FAD-dependent oxidoreductase [Stieleria sp. JC731]MCC9600426.1 FAD-dependent oxidoreductase [Stieleria sp. JC731]
MTPGKSETVIVVGGGIVGLSCAHYLTEQGYKVTIIDRKTIGSGCSHANCGYICPSHVLPLTEPGAIGIAMKSLLNPNAPFRVKPRFSPALIRWMLEFARRCRKQTMLDSAKHLHAILSSSMTEYRQLVSEGYFDGQWKNNGLLYVFRSEHALAEFQETCDLIDQHFGVSITKIDGSDLPQFDAALRSGLAGACLYEDDCSVRPDLLVSQWLANLRQRGVQIIENSEVIAFEKQSGRLKSVQTSKGTQTADHFVIATGAWSPFLSESLGCRIPIEPGKGYSVTMDRPDPCPTHPMLFPEHKVGVTPFDDGCRLGSIMEFAGYDTSISPKRIEQLKRSAEPYLRSTFDTKVSETWFGWRPMTWDSLPIIGPVPKLANAFLATGHNMLGMSLASATGRLIGELVSGSSPHIDVTGFSPGRFN